MPSTAVLVLIAGLGLRDQRHAVLEAVPARIELIETIAGRIEIGRCHHTIIEFPVDPSLGPRVGSFCRHWGLDYR